MGSIGGYVFTTYIKGCFIYACPHSVRCSSAAYKEQDNHGSPDETPDINFPLVMDLNQEIAELDLAILGLDMRIRNRPRRRIFWARPWLLMRHVEGQYTCIWA